MTCSNVTPRSAWKPPPIIRQQLAKAGPSARVLLTWHCVFEDKDNSVKFLLRTLHWLRRTDTQALRFLPSPASRPSCGPDDGRALGCVPKTHTQINGSIPQLSQICMFGLKWSLSWAADWQRLAEFWYWATSNNSPFKVQEIKVGLTAADKCSDYFHSDNFPGPVTAGVRVPNGSERFHDPAKEQVEIRQTLEVNHQLIKGNMI